MSTPAPSGPPITYAAAGVDVEAGDRAVELMKASVRRAHAPRGARRPRRLRRAVRRLARSPRMTRPVLATSTDGVGTKVAIAQALDMHDTIGFDLVGMVVDDIVVCGAEPLFMTDYIATGKVVPERIAAIVARHRRGVRRRRAPPSSAARPPSTRACSSPDEYDVAGAATGVVEYADVLGPHRVRGRRRRGRAGVLSGLHSNGYSLVRRSSRAAGWALDRDVAEFGRTLGEELLEPDPGLRRATCST